ncbi:putative ribokinase [Elasticomyces elasticus]|nr:putative ribokinase [Elasticomyces elasticus]KAK3667320.1 putative ribokinase [Elasticomyces elasticus]KAK4932600.1 putative ribokinase [Elasticomyces elasticus]KAK5769622.1 putative ribokinase [Elasticomyces elasticus]
MASDLGSAIDDSFMPIYIQPSIPPSYAPSRYNGPRSGHWTVSNESGSGIDDRCPTVWSVASGRGTADPYGAAAVKPIRANLLKAVGHAGVEKKVAAEAEVTARYQVDYERQASIRSEARHVEEIAPKGFYVPRNETARAAKAQAKDKDMEKATALTSAAKRIEPVRKPEIARASPPLPAVKSKKPSHVPPFAHSSQSRGIRIVSKDGKEAFVQLPSLPRISEAPARTRAAVTEERAVEATQKSEKPAKAQAEPAPSLRDETAKIAAEALMSGGLPATKKQKGQKKAKQKPAPVMPPTPPRSEKASEAGLGVGGLFENTSKAPSVAASKAVSARSLQEAIRAISQNSKKSATPQANNDEWVRAKTPSQRRSEGIVDNDADARPRSNHEFQAVGEGWAGAPTPAVRSREPTARQKTPPQVDEGWARVPTPINGSRQASGRQKTPPPAHGFSPAGQGWVQTASPKQASARQKTPSHNNGFQPAGKAWVRQASLHNLSRARDPIPASVLKVLSPLINDTSSSTREHAFNGNGLGSQNGREEPTVFAGKGWISPHPLSVAPTRFASPPQSHISLPFTTPHGREMSYEDWKAVQDGQVEHKRFSRAESVVGGQILAVAESIARGGSGRVSVRGSVAGSQVYHKATVESEHGSRRSGSVKPTSEAYGWGALPGFDGTSEEKAPASEVSGSAYRRYLENIVSQNRSGQLADAQDQRQLVMPWDGQGQGNFTQHPIPEAGETLTAHSFDTGLGGKGANQAVACARLADEHVKVSMAGQVGDDSFGTDYLDALKREDIDGTHVRKLKGQKTGVSTIIVDDATGENRILFAPNANYALSDEYEESWDLVPQKAEVVVFQLEIPSRVVLHNIRKASQSGKHVILNPAPAEALPDSIYQHIDTLVMNESESALLAGDASKSQTPEQLASDFLQKGVKDAVIITLGGDGLVFATASGSSGRVDAKKVKVVDTTAAGDTFLGGYAVQRAKDTGKSFDHKKALEFATLAASVTVQRKGAMAAIPMLAELTST